MYGLRLTTPPASEPLTITQLKDWVRLSSNAENGIVSGLITAARTWAEKTLGRQLVTASWEMTLDHFPWPNGWQFLEYPALFPDPHTIRMPKAPLRSVESIRYYDFGNVLRTLATTVYEVDISTDPGRISLGQGQVWPVTRLRPGAVKIAFTAGYGTPDEVPEDIKTALKLIIAHWFENREAVMPGGMTEVPMSAKALLDACWNGELEYGIG